MVQIKSKNDDDFIGNTIVKLPVIHVWLGAANTIGTRSFKWFDGSKLTYSYWAPAYPSGNITKPLRLEKTGNVWHDYVLISAYSMSVVCEKIFFALQSRIVRQADKFNIKFTRLDEQISSLLRSTITNRDEFVKLITNAKSEMVNSIEKNYLQYCKIISDQKLTK